MNMQEKEDLLNVAFQNLIRKYGLSKCLERPFMRDRDGLFYTYLDAASSAIVCIPAEIENVENLTFCLREKVLHGLYSMKNLIDQDIEKLGGGV